MNQNEQTSGFGWSENPFSLRILPQLFVGYADQTQQLGYCIANRSKVVLLLGPTGAGKTTTLKWLEARTDENNIFYYLTKLPDKPEDLAEAVKGIFKPSIYDVLANFFGVKVTLLNLPKYVNKKLGKRHLFLLVDECHESDTKVLEWLRTMVDQIDNMSVIMAGLPTFEARLKQDLETLLNRVTQKIELVALSKLEMEEMIRKRVVFAGGKEIPFSREAIEAIYQKTGGFPRAVLKFCDQIIEDAQRKNITFIDEALVSEIQAPSAAAMSMNFIDTLPEKQKEIIGMLSKNDFTPGQLIEHMSKEDYQDEENAVRSVNNILRRLMIENYIIREKRGKSFVYKLSPKIRTLLISS